MKTPAELAEQFRAGFAAMERMDPDDVDRLVGAITGHLRQLRSEQFGCMSKLPPPGAPIRDPRDP
ncbi:MAG: hypothetical protein NT062_15635 [Proteobacteria bacterium]|nr:hypothetical protein [Pseudomonadota bacterium]